MSRIARVRAEVREGRFQRWLSLIAGISAAMTGVEVAFQHYEGSYSRRVTYTPVRTVHWASFVPRFHPSDFRVYSEDGVGAEWPISYRDLKPYYELIERELPVAGPTYYPWGDPHGYPYGPHPMGGVGDALIRGCTKLGIGVSAGGPVAILSGSRADRPHCIDRGFCIQGCKVGAKASTLITHVPDAIKSGAGIRANSMVSRIHLGANRRVTGVSYFDEEGHEHFQKAKAVAVCGYAIETPRLLVNSACPGFENGLPTF